MLPTPAPRHLRRLVLIIADKEKALYVDGSRMEFVVTNGSGDWDKPNDGSGNYRITEPGVYRLHNGALQRQ